jgi:hypothetical protein
MFNLTGNNAAEKNPEDIPKEELMHLCMKMNKRMQAMELKGKELVKKKSTLLSERQKLLELMKSEISFPFNAKDDQEIDLFTLENCWVEWKRNTNNKFLELEQKLINNELSYKQKISALESKHRVEKENISSHDLLVINELVVESSIKKLTLELDNLTKEKEVQFK